MTERAIVKTSATTRLYTVYFPYLAVRVTGLHRGNRGLGKVACPGSSSTLLESSANGPIVTRARARDPPGLSEIPDHKSASGDGKRGGVAGENEGTDGIENGLPPVVGNYRDRERAANDGRRLSVASG